MDMASSIETIHVKVATAVFFIVILISMGTASFVILERWTVVDSFYFTVATLTTIGYGDLVPTTDFSKIFTSFFAIAGVGLFLYLLAVIAQHSMRKETVKVERRIHSINNKIHKRKQ